MVINKIKTFLEIITTYPLFLLSHLVPRSTHIWIYIGWHQSNEMEIFADNTKYLFLHTSTHETDITHIWLAKDKKFAALLRSKGYKSYYEKSLRGIWYALRAKVTFVDANLNRENARFSGGTILVQLLHGKGYKKGGYSQKPIKKFDYICVPSQFVSKLLPPHITSSAHICITGYPRDDVFYTKPSDYEIGMDTVLKERIQDIKTRNNKIIWYAPTFRRSQPTFDIENILNPHDLTSWLEENSLYLFVSLHPKYRNQNRTSLGKRIIFVDDSDIYPLLPLVDILINDYSSLFTDFLLLNKPIVFYPYDLDEYQKNEGFNIDYMAYSPGPKAYTIGECRRYIKEILEKDAYSEDRIRVRDEYHAYHDGHSSRRVADTMRSILNI